LGADPRRRIATLSGAPDREQLKRELAAREWPDMNHYAEGKGELIDTIIARAGGPPRAPEA